MLKKKAGLHGGMLIPRKALVARGKPFQAEKSEDVPSWSGG